MTLFVMWKRKSYHFQMLQRMTGTLLTYIWASMRMWLCLIMWKRYLFFYASQVLYQCWHLVWYFSHDIFLFLMRTCSSLFLICTVVYPLIILRKTQFRLLHKQNVMISFLSCCFSLDFCSLNGKEKSFQCSCTCCFDIIGYIMI